MEGGSGSAARRHGDSLADGHACGLCMTRRRAAISVDARLEIMRTDDRRERRAVSRAPLDTGMVGSHTSTDHSSAVHLHDLRIYAVK